MSEIQDIRLAIPNDLPSIVEVYNLSIPDGLATADTVPVTVESRKEWFASHTGNRPLYVVAEKNKVIAFLSFKSFYGRPAYSITAEIGIYIHPDHQKKGLGKILLQKAIDEAPKLKLENLLGFIFGHNEPSIKLFKKFGFEEWGNLPHLAKMPNGYVDLIIFGKKIN